MIVHPMFILLGEGQLVALEHIAAVERVTVPGKEDRSLVHLTSGAKIPSTVPAPELFDRIQVAKHLLRSEAPHKTGIKLSEIPADADAAEIRRFIERTRDDAR